MDRKRWWKKRKETTPDTFELEFVMPKMNSPLHMVLDDSVDVTVNFKAENGKDPVGIQRVQFPALNTMTIKSGDRFVIKGQVTFVRHLFEGGSR